MLCPKCPWLCMDLKSECGTQNISTHLCAHLVHPYFKSWIHPYSPPPPYIPPSLPFASCPLPLIAGQFGWVINFNCRTFLHSVNRILHPVNRILHPVNRILYPVNSILHPVNRILHPVNRILHPVNRILYPVNSILHPVKRPVTQ